MLGNHDTERRSRLDGTPDNIAVWANNARKHYFPVPTANELYRRSVEEVPHIGPYEHNNLLAGDLSPEDKRHYEELKSGLAALLASE